AISTVRRIEIATATCCGLAMTTGEISSFESKHLRTKNRLPEYLVAPLVTRQKKGACPAGVFWVPY
ncbi:MAG TPA: hypothetical protein VMX36_13255, partial [Sedimentisphaerales bacterium]|nr:hypothetical protein [Sedimentisphaerales bacterium]